MANSRFRSFPLSCALLALPALAPPPPAFAPWQPEIFQDAGGLVNAWADFDGDGDPDLAVSFHTHAGGGIRLYRNDSGRFHDVGSRLGLPVRGGEMRSLAWGDYDGDGDVDLYAAGAGPDGGISPPGEVYPQSLLFRNDGARGFVEVGRAAGVAYPGPTSRQAVWVDYDNDGDLDLFVAQRWGRNRMYRNEGARFTDASTETGLADPRRTVGACWFDADGDGDLDVFLANQAGDKDALYRNDRGKFTDIAPALRIHQPERSLAEGSVSCAVGDYDNDGNLDLFVAGYGVSYLYRGDGRGAFQNVARDAGLALEEFATGSSWGDFDNDGRLDLYVVTYFTEGERYRSRGRLFRNEGGRFIDVAPEGSLRAADHGAQWADFDRDGDLDLALTESWPGQTSGHHLLLRNELDAPFRRRSLEVSVLDPAGHQTRAGAEVRLFDARGELLATRIVTTGEGYDAQSALPVHFGLASADRVTVEVVFMTPEGRRSQRVERARPQDHVGKPLVIRQEQVPVTR